MGSSLVNVLAHAIKQTHEEFMNSLLQLSFLLGERAVDTGVAERLDAAIQVAPQVLAAADPLEHITITRVGRKMLADAKKGLSVGPAAPLLSADFKVGPEDVMRAGVALEICAGMRFVLDDGAPREGGWKLPCYRACQRIIRDRTLVWREVWPDEEDAAARRMCEEAFGTMELEGGDNRQQGSLINGISAILTVVVMSLFLCANGPQEPLSVFFGIMYMMSLVVSGVPYIGDALMFFVASSGDATGTLVCPSAFMRTTQVQPLLFLTLTLFTWGISGTAGKFLSSMVPMKIKKLFEKLMPPGSNPGAAWVMRNLFWSLTGTMVSFAASSLPQVVSQRIYEDSGYTPWLKDQFELWDNQFYDWIASILDGRVPRLLLLAGEAIESLRAIGDAIMQEGIVAALTIPREQWANSTIVIKLASKLCTDICIMFGVHMAVHHNAVEILKRFDNKLVRMLLMLVIHAANFPTRMQATCVNFTLLVSLLMCFLALKCSAVTSDMGELSLSDRGELSPSDGDEPKDVGKQEGS